MRVGLITPGFSASEEDWCIPALLDLVRTLAAGDEVTVFTLRYPHTRERYGVHGAEVVPFGGAQRRGPSRLPLLWRAVVRILRENRKRRFDVLHALWAHEPGFVASLAGRLTGTPVLVSVLGGELVDLPEIGYGGQRSTVNRWLIRRALHGAARVTVGSESLERIVERHVTPGKLVRWPLGVDRGRFFPQPSDTADSPLPRPLSRPPFTPARERGASTRPSASTGSGKFPPLPGGCEAWPVAAPVGEGGQGGEGILHVASLSPVKDQATLLRAFAIVGERLPDARLHVVGDGEARRDLGRLAEQLDVAGRIEWHGAVDHGVLADVYRRAGLVVLSSLFESQGMVVLEAAACGCPVVGTAAGALPELGGPTVKPGDVEGLGALMLSVLRDPGKRAAIVAAQSDALPAFDLARTVETLRRTYRSLVIP